MGRAGQARGVRLPPSRQPNPWAPRSLTSHPASCVRGCHSSLGSVREWACRLRAAKRGAVTLLPRKSAPNVAVNKILTQETRVRPPPFPARGFPPEAQETQALPAPSETTRRTTVRARQRLVNTRPERFALARLLQKETTFQGRRPSGGLAAALRLCYQRVLRLGQRRLLSLHVPGTCFLLTRFFPAGSHRGNGSHGRAWPPWAPGPPR